STIETASVDGAIKGGIGAGEDIHESGGIAGTVAAHGNIAQSQRAVGYVNIDQAAHRAHRSRGVQVTKAGVETAVDQDVAAERSGTVAISGQIVQMHRTQTFDADGTGSRAVESAGREVSSVDIAG